MSSFGTLVDWNIYQKVADCKTHTKKTSGRYESGVNIVLLYFTNQPYVGQDLLKRICIFVNFLFYVVSFCHKLFVFHLLLFLFCIFRVPQELPAELDRKAQSVNR